MKRFPGERKFIITPIYKNGGVVKVVIAEDSVNAAKKCFGEAIASIQRGWGSLIIVTTLGGNKYNVRRLTESWGRL